MIPRAPTPQPVIQAECLFSLTWGTSWLGYKRVDLPSPANSETGQCDWA